MNSIQVGAALDPSTLSKTPLQPQPDGELVPSEESSISPAYLVPGALDLSSMPVSDELSSEITTEIPQDSDSSKRRASSSSSSRRRKPVKVEPPIRYWEYKTPAEAAGQHFLNLANDPLLMDGYKGLRTWTDNHFIRILNPTPDIDLGMMPFTDFRWKIFIRNYTHDDEFPDFLGRLATLQEMQEYGYQFNNLGNHTMGNCLLGISVHNSPPRVLFTSRACNWLPTSGLDLSLGALVCQYLAGKLGIPTDQVTFDWHIGRTYLHCVYSLPYLKRAGLLDQLDRSTRPGHMIHHNHERYMAGATTKRQQVMRWIEKFKTDEDGNFTKEYEVFHPYLPQRYLEKADGAYIKYSTMKQREASDE